jgi:hypothetical protein
MPPRKRDYIPVATYHQALQGGCNAWSAHVIVAFYPVNQYAGKRVHGFMAEHAGHFQDTVAGLSSKIVGDDNKKGGPDRMVNGVLVQVKYYKTAGKTVGAMFEGNRLMYMDSGAPMQIEVPKDQYHDAIALLEQRIANGKVDGITDTAQGRTEI